MANRLSLIFLLFFCLPAVALSQSNPYSLSFYPDIWYNSVDGPRLGVQVLGEQEGTFKDGPHRLEVGFWLGTAFPDLPASYYVSFTEPIPFISDFGSEGNIRLQSSVRAGYSFHKVSLNKRFQRGFNELQYQELSLGFSQENMFDAAYRQFPALWSREWKSLITFDVNSSGFSPLGRLLVNVKLLQNVNQASGSFSAARAEVLQLASLGSGFSLNLRAFGGLLSDGAPSEYRFSLAHREPVYWLQNGFSRAKGTIPNGFFDDGFVHISGGMNLRGYSDYYYSPLTKVLAFNAEFVFPNPVQALLSNNMLGNFAQFKSYVFFDAGTFSTPDGFGTVAGQVSNSVADAGIGFQFSINIPDYLGKDRGFAIRYELPMWLSEPDNPFSDPSVLISTSAPAFKIRHLIGIGAVISL